MLEEARRLARANAKEAEEARRHARAAKEMKEAAAAAAARPPWDGSFDVESQNLSADERHWVGWREEQLEALGKRPRAGELIVVLESRYHSGQGKQLVTQHDPAKYEGYAARLRAAVDELNARAGWRVADLVQVPREPTHWSKVLHGVDACRLGAFEIMASTLAAPPAAFAADGSATGGGGSGELTSHLLHSKLATRKWPSISRVEAALGRALRPLRIVPCVLCVDGSTRAVAPLPPQMSLVGEGKEALDVPLEYREGGDGDGEEGGGEAAAVTLAASSARFCVLKVAATADTEALESPMQVWPDDDGSLVARPALRPTARPFLLKLVCEAATPPHAPLPSAELRVLASARRTARCTLPVEQCAKADAKGVIELRWEGHVEDILVDEGGTMRRIGAWGDALSATAEGLVKFAPVTVRVGPAAIAAAKNATFIPATTATEQAPAKAKGPVKATAAAKAAPAPAKAMAPIQVAAATAPPAPVAAPAPRPSPPRRQSPRRGARARARGGAERDGGGGSRHTRRRRRRRGGAPLPEAQLRALSVDGIKRLLESNGFDDDSTRARMSAAVSLCAPYSTAKLDPLEGTSLWRSSMASPSRPPPRPRPPPSPPPSPPLGRRRRAQAAASRSPNVSLRSTDSPRPRRRRRSHSRPLRASRRRSNSGTARCRRRWSRANRTPSPGARSRRSRSRRRAPCSSR